MDEIEEQVTVFRALSDPTRLQLIGLLRRQQHPDALCVNALAGLLGVSQSAVSQHLRILRSIGLVSGERRGYHIHYFVNHEAMKRCHSVVSTALTIEESSKVESCKDYCEERRNGNAPFK